jgi:hypothetical protein
MMMVHKGPKHVGECKIIKWWKYCAYVGRFIANITENARNNTRKDILTALSHNVEWKNKHEIRI